MNPRRRRQHPRGRLASSVLLLGLVAAQTSATEPISLSSSESPTDIETNNFSASYLARYQHFADDACGGPNADVQVFCRGKIVLIGVSNESLQCSYVTNEDEWNGFHCANTCADCEGLYLERSKIEGGIFGEIAFQCLGQEQTDVDSYMVYLGGEDGNCLEKVPAGGGDSRNYHVAQLGVQCPSDVDPTHIYSFDDYHFECSTGATAGKFDQRYTCLAGANCQGQACQVRFDDVIVHADSHNFYECFDALNEDVVVGPKPPAGPLQAGSKPGRYKARFEAKWQLQLDTTVCLGEFATKRIRCLNDTRIANVEPLFPNVDCDAVNNSETVMECNDLTEENFVNGFSGVRYDCLGDTLPETQVEYLSASSFCDTDTLVDKQVGHLLQLGVVCNVPLTTANFVSNRDSYFECGPENDYDIIDGIYTCKQLNDFSGDASPVLVPLDVVTMRTDSRWSLERPEICFDYKNRTSEGGEAQWLADKPTPPNPETSLVGPILDPTMVPTQQVPSPGPLVIPSGTTYTVDYAARFQQVVSPGCTNSNPTMVLTCVGEVRNVSVSHPSIACGVESIKLDDGRNAVLCENKCVGEACGGVFLSNNQLGGPAPFGEVYFTCFGETPMHTDGTFIVVEGGPGFCDGTDASGTSYNLNLAQMGVRCPQEGGSWEYMVDDLHGDCGVVNRGINVDNQYTCFVGRACGNEPCLVSFDQLIVAADPHQFQGCIQSSNGSPIPALSAPDVPLKNAGTYIATFQAKWEFVIDSSCVGNASPTFISCTNGSIRLVDTLGFGASCAVTSQNSIECTNSASEAGVTYECESSSAIPETHVEYSSGEVRCDVSKLVERRLQLGILCGPGDYIFGDIFLECGPSNAFDIFDGAIYTCLSTLSVPAASQLRIPEVQISTDYRWPLFSSESCYSYTPVSKRHLAERGIIAMEFTMGSSSSRDSSGWATSLGMSVTAATLLAGVF